MQLLWTQNHLQTDFHRITTGCILPSNRSLFVSNPLQLYSYDPFGQPSQLQQPRQSTLLMKLSVNGRFLALASDIIDLIDVERARVLRQFTDHTNTITGITSPENSPHTWATVGADKTMRILDSRKHPGQVFCKRFDSRYQSICYTPNCDILFFGGDNICVFDLRALNTISIIRTEAQVLDLQCHPEECIVLGCTDDKMVKVWDICTQECVCQSFPLDSQPKKVLFDPSGKSIIACTSNQLYAIEHEPFNVVNQVPYSTAKASNNFLVMDGEAVIHPSQVPSDSPSSCQTLDAVFENEMLLHFGYFSGRNSLELRAVNLQELLTPAKTLPQLSQASKTSPRLAYDGNALDFDRFPSPSALSLNSPEVDSVASSDVSPMLADAPQFLSSAPDASFLVRKLPRSTSSMSRNLKTPTPQMPKRSLPPPQENGQNRGRSSSTHSLHASARRVNSGDKTRVHNESTVVVKPKSQTPRMIPKNPVKPPSYPAKETDKSAVDRKPARGTTLDFDALINTHKSTLNLIAARKTSIKRIKATMKARNSNEDEVLDEASHLQDKTVLAYLLHKHSKAKSLRFAARVLPELRMLLSNPNSDVVDIALDLLQEISSSLLPIIRQGIASNPQSIGVDVQAEQRQMWSIKCKECLTEIYVNSHFIVSKLTEEQQLKFNAAVERFEVLCNNS